MSEEDVFSLSLAIPVCLCLYIIGAVPVNVPRLVSDPTPEFVPASVSSSNCNSVSVSDPARIFDSDCTTVSGTIEPVCDAEGTRDPHFYPGDNTDHVSLPVCVSVSLSVSVTDPGGATGFGSDTEGNLVPVVGAITPPANWGLLLLPGVYRSSGAAPLKGVLSRFRTCFMFFLLSELVIACVLILCYVML